jgi:hypothetical protein
LVDPQMLAGLAAEDEALDNLSQLRPVLAGRTTMTDAEGRKRRADGRPGPPTSIRLRFTDFRPHDPNYARGGPSVNA